MNNRERPKVYIPNKSHHDFSKARRYGELVYLTSGTVKRLGISQLYREITERMEDAEPQDYLLISSLSILNSIVASIMAHRFGKVNFLLWKNDSYVVRRICLEASEFQTVETESADQGE